MAFRLRASETRRGSGLSIFHSVAGVPDVRGAFARTALRQRITQRGQASDQGAWNRDRFVAQRGQAAGPLLEDSARGHIRQVCLRTVQLSPRVNKKAKHHLLQGQRRLQIGQIRANFGPFCEGQLPELVVPGRSHGADIV